MSDFFDQNKDDYIDRLFAVSAKGDWTGWIEFCLQGVVEQAEDTRVRYERLITLNREFHERVQASGGSVRLSRLVDEFFLSPLIRVTTARDVLEVT